MNSLFVAYLTSNASITVWCYWRSLASFHINQSSPVTVSDNSLKSLLRPTPFHSLQIYFAGKINLRKQTADPNDPTSSSFHKETSGAAVFVSGYETCVWFIVLTIRVTFSRVYRSERFHELQALVFYYTCLP